MSKTQSATLKHRAEAADQSPATCFVGADVSKQGAIFDRVREYRASDQPTPVKRSFWSRMLRPVRKPKAIKRVLDQTAKGVAVERFRNLLVRAGCEVESVEISDGLVMIEFTFLADGSHCTAFLTDQLRDGSYLRCNIVGRVGSEFPLEQINKLNTYSKYLRFYNIRNNSLFIEFSFVLIDLPDRSVLANIEVFHLSVNYIISHGFEYSGMND